MNNAKLSLAITLGAIALLCHTVIVSAKTSGPNARSLNEVQAIWLDSNDCMGQLAEELDDHKFVSSNGSASADGVLKVDVHQLDANTGASARFSAQLLGDNGKVLFNTTGREDSVSVAELCEDVSEDIFDRIRTRMGE